MEDMSVQNRPGLLKKGLHVFGLKYITAEAHARRPGSQRVTNERESVFV